MSALLKKLSTLPVGGVLTLLFTLSLAVLSGCATMSEAIGALPTPTLTPSPSPTSIVTPTPSPSPRPTRTPTLIPTIHVPLESPTPRPTATPIPTSTPRPTIAQFPERVVPEPFGVEIHFTRTSDAELDLLQAAGFGFIRMDMFWHVVEKAPGQYDFSEYDALVNEMTRRGIRMVFILDYGNALYEGGVSPNSPGGRAAFARFGAAAARRYRGQGIIWEIWNEPNLEQFWAPTPNPEHYALLAIVTADAIHRADPTALVVAPALSGYDWYFWTIVGELGVFKHIDGVTIHSYGVLVPEHLLPPYLQLRALVNRYSPTWKLPILSGEWGFPSIPGWLSEDEQGWFLVRQWLFNLSHDIDLSIWYDWRDDGLDPHNAEHNFGTVHNDLTPKPGYRAAKTLIGTLNGYRFLRRIPVESGEDFLMLFQKEDQLVLVAWTVGDPHTVVLPLSLEGVDVVEVYGNGTRVEGDGKALPVRLLPAPRYLLLGNDPAAARLGGWRPYETINCLRPEGDASIRVVFESYFDGPIYGTLHVRAGGELIGSLEEIVVPPGATKHVRVPVDLEGLTGNVPAAIVFVPEDGALLPLQTANVWIQLPIEPSH